jgi:hypothetical protein
MDTCVQILKKCLHTVLEFVQNRFLNHQCAVNASLKSLQTVHKMLTAYPGTNKKRPYNTHMNGLQNSIAQAAEPYIVLSIIPPQ